MSHTQSPRASSSSRASFERARCVFSLKDLAGICEEVESMYRRAASVRAVAGSRDAFLARAEERAVFSRAIHGEIRRTSGEPWRAAGRMVSTIPEIRPTANASTVFAALDEAESTTEHAYAAALFEPHASRTKQTLLHQLRCVAASRRAMRDLGERVA